jgi:hypothetical protein
MCVGVGIACNVLVVFPLRSLPWARSVHAPSGPRKSGIPVKVVQKIYRNSCWIKSTSRCRDSGPSESYEVLAVLDQLCQSLCFCINHFNRFEEFLLSGFGSSVSHDDYRERSKTEAWMAWKRSVCSKSFGVVEFTRLCLAQGCSLISCFDLVGTTTVFLHHVISRL